MPECHERKQNTKLSVAFLRPTIWSEAHTIYALRAHTPLGVLFFVLLSQPPTPPPSHGDGTILSIRHTGLSTPIDNDP
jgi:hypothetical protein